MSKILIDVCDRCGKPEGLVLHSGDEQHYLCENCAALFLGAFINPAAGRFISFEAGEEVTCVFCGGRWSPTDGSTSTPFLFETKGKEHVCDSCLLTAVRLAGKFRLVIDC